MGGNLAAGEEAGSKLFVSMLAVWSKQVPARLTHQSPGALLRLLELGSRAGGISQLELRQELGITQPHLSKLMHKLVLERWVRVKEPKIDRRRKLVTTTAAARALLATLKSELNARLRAARTKQALAPKPKAKLARDRRGITIIPGQVQFKMSESE